MASIGLLDSRVIIDAIIIIDAINGRNHRSQFLEGLLASLLS
jgi:hypothetical protein